jgi:hypothetical protein
MRLLIADETLDLIAGGYSSDGSGSIPSVTITGHPPQDGSGGASWGGGDPGSVSVGGGATPTEPPPDCSKRHNWPLPTTPPVAPSPKLAPSHCLAIFTAEHVDADRHHA